MGLHQRHSHGRVFRGLAAREQLEIIKRDSHGSDIKMHVPEGFDLQVKQTADNSDDPNAVQVVYVTLAQTFSGAAIYSTMSDDPTELETATAAASRSVLLGGPVAATRSATSSQTKGTSIATVTPAQSRSAATTLATATSSGDMSTDASTAVGTPIRANSSSTPSSDATSEQTQSTGMSSGGKAGLAIGIILAIALIGGLAFFFLRKKKTPRNEEALNEKHSSFPRGAPIGAAAATGAFAASRGMQYEERRSSTQTEKVPASVRSTRTASTAPRLSLRPITQLMTNFGENRKSGGNALDVAAAGGVAGSQLQPSAWERRPVNSANDNPFNDGTSQDARSNSGLTDPFDEKRDPNASTATLNVQRPSWEGAEAQTPNSATFGTAAAVAVAAGGPGNGPAPPRGPNNVHRVQLDFKPSMDDELELRSGQLVRMLHEYDDGWALCIRMDRSQQGVAPRTCLSKLPVKPRPQGPPGSSPQGSRPGTSQSNRGPPNAPGMMVPRPLTPTSSSRSPSPPDARQNSTSPPTGPGRVQRKPVPGMAI